MTVKHDHINKQHWDSTNMINNDKPTNNKHVTILLIIHRYYYHCYYLYMCVTAKSDDKTSKQNRGARLLLRLHRGDPVHRLLAGLLRRHAEDVQPVLTGPKRRLRVITPPVPRWAVSLLPAFSSWPGRPFERRGSGRVTDHRAAIRQFMCKTNPPSQADRRVEGCATILYYTILYYTILHCTVLDFGERARSIRVSSHM